MSEMLLHSRSAPALRRLLPISRIKEVLLMMPATEKEFIRDYIERTKLNYERLKALLRVGKVGVETLQHICRVVLDLFEI